MSKHLIQNATLVNEGVSYHADVLLSGQFIEKIIKPENASLGEEFLSGVLKTDAKGLLLMPGAIDDQVHFREPGLTHKGTIYSESRAAAAGGVTSFMEMPNTNPQTINFKELESKFQIAANDALVNHSFYFGATNENSHLVADVDVKNVCGVKVFMGSSTGNMLVDKEEALERIFKNSKTLVATHCEEEQIVRSNIQKYKEKYGEDIPFHLHPVIRSTEACYASSSKAVALAKKHDARLHVLHLSTQKELALFEKNKDISQKRITAEACIHHLWFSEKDYRDKQQWIKWNPAVKTEADRQAIFNALSDGSIDVIATDHAPHSITEKSKGYLNCPSGGPLVQHSIVAMLDFCEQGLISIERIVELMCHNPAILFQVHKRGYIREGYYADLVLVNPLNTQKVAKDNLLYHCGWSPFEGHQFSNQIHSTFVNGEVVYKEGEIFNQSSAMALTFNR